MYQLTEGPFIHAIGDARRPEFSARTAVLPHDRVSFSVVVSPDGTFKSLVAFTEEELLGPLPRPVLRASGVARAGNSAKSTVFAALLAQEFNTMLQQQPGYDPDRVVIGIANGSSSAAIGWEYESEGVNLGWRNTNTMLMPSALPSAIGTQISSAIKTHNATITFLNDILGMCSAMEYTYVNFFHDRADYAFLIGAEEVSYPLLKINERRPKELLINFDGAAGMLLTKKMIGDSAWRVTHYRHTVRPEEISIPAGWEDAPVLNIDLTEQQAALSSIVFPHAVYTILTTPNTGKTVLRVTVENRSSFAWGFELVGK